MFVISLAYPPPGSAKRSDARRYVVVGGAWAALLALVLWPIRPYRPARLAIGECFERWRTTSSQVVEALEAPPARVRRRFPPGVLSVRAALEHARATLATIRRGRPGESGRGERLLVLSETADRMFGNLIALVETIDAIPPSAREPHRQSIIVAALRDVDTRAARARRRASRTERQTGTTAVHVLGRAAAGQPNDRSGGRRAGDAGRHGRARVDGQRNTRMRPCSSIALRQFAGVAAANVAALDGGNAPAPARRRPKPKSPAEPLALLAPLRSVRRPRLARAAPCVSRRARHRDRRVGSPARFDLPRGYWVTITVVIILQPYTGVDDAQGGAARHRHRRGRRAHRGARRGVP